MQELGIATLTSCFVNSKRSKDSDPRTTPNDFYYFQPKGGDGVQVPPAAANAFFSLVNDNLLPGWALALAPLDKLRASKDSRPHALPRAWIGDGILLLLPKVADNEVQFELGLVDEAKGLTKLHDVDTGTEFIVKLPENQQSMWVLNGEFRLFMEKVLLSSS